MATPLARASFDSTAAEARIAATYKVGALDGFAAFGRAEVAALGAIVDYLELTQRGRLPLLRPPVREGAGGLMQIDAATRRNLELTRSLAGGRDGSLLATDRPHGDRRRRAAARDPAERAVDRRAADPRAAGRGGAVPRRPGGRTRGAGAAAQGAGPRAGAVAAGARPRRPARSRGGARRAGAGGAAARRAAGRAAGGAGGGAGGARRARRAGRRSSTRRWSPSRRTSPATAASWRRASTPSSTRPGGCATRAAGSIAELQAEYVRRSGVNALKIKHNNVLGYFIETPAGHAERMLKPPLAELFVHRQTTAGADPLHHAGAGRDRDEDPERRRPRARDREADLRGPARGDPRPRRRDRRHRQGAGRDRRGERARRSRARPRTGCARRSADGRAFRIEAGRHPVVEAALRRSGAELRRQRQRARRRRPGRAAALARSPGRTWPASPPTCGRTR